MSGISVLLVSFVPPLCMAAGGWVDRRLRKCNKYHAFWQHFCRLCLLRAGLLCRYTNHFESILSSQLQSSNKAASHKQLWCSLVLLLHMQCPVRSLAMTRSFYAAQLGTAMMRPAVSTNVHLNGPISCGRHGLSFTGSLNV